MEDVVRGVCLMVLLWLTFSTALSFLGGPVAVLRRSGLLRLGRRGLRLLWNGALAGVRCLGRRRRRRVRRDLFGGSVGGIR